MSCRKRQDCTTRIAAVDRLEPRRLLSGNVTANLSGGVLRITGDSQDNAITVRAVERSISGRASLRSGTTSVSLDTDLLATAAGLTVSSANSSGTAASGFAVGFPINSSTDLVYSTSPFSVVSGAVRHTGTVGFNDNAIVVGNFDIGFDSDRVAGDNSGFFVRDTVGGLGILFDIASPQGLSATGTEFVVESADLVVSPEFAQVLLTQNLASSNLTGADVGDATIDGLSKRATRSLLEISGQSATTINSASSAVTFARSDVRALRIATLDGNDTILAGPMRFTKAFSIDAGAGNDRVFLSEVSLNNTATILLGAGNDYANVFGGRSPRALNIDGGAGTDILVRASTFYSSLNDSNIETVLPA